MPAGHGDAWELISLDDQVYVAISDCIYREERSEPVVSEGFVEFHYNLSGSVVAQMDARDCAHVGSLDMIVCCPGDEARYEIRCEPGRRRSVALYVRPAHFARFLDSAAPQAAAIRAEIASVGPRQIHFRHARIDPAQVRVVNQLIDNPYRDARRLLYAQAKIWELLCAGLDTWALHIRQAHAGLTLSPRDVKRLHEARSLVLDDLARMRTIPELARAVGINTSKLKSGFRMLYGCTVFELALNARMDRALELLTRRGASVADAAAAVGYLHPSSFSVAFQQHFGFAPRHARRMPDGTESSSKAGAAKLEAVGSKEACRPDRS